MKLLRAKFENFRLLRDLEIEFSSKPDKNLTVILADTGKTTILYGLQWALYGDEALPAKGEYFHLHPMDWDVMEGTRVPITVTVEFELTTYCRTSGGMCETRRRYRLVRSAFEDVDSQARRSTSNVKLFVLNETGAMPIDAPETLIKEELPPALREIFFIDGFWLLTFITEADVARSTKRASVQRAIRSLLGLGVIEEELPKVSELMNSIFLEMIGANPYQGSIIQRAEISQEFDIIVYGPNDQALNPDRDLNFASLQALALAFILALIKVSEVEAPNVMDAPLGMMDQFVKSSVLRTVVRESAQLILFVTENEIAGCEEIIDQAAGIVLTLTN